MSSSKEKRQDSKAFFVRKGLVKYNYPYPSLSAQGSYSKPQLIQFSQALLPTFAFEFIFR